MTIFQSAQSITTGLSLVAFALAIALMVYRARSRSAIKIIETTPETDRLRTVETLAEWVRVDLKGLSAKQRENIVLEQIRNKAKRELMLALLAAFAGLLLAAVALASILSSHFRPTLDGETKSVDSTDFTSKCIDRSKIGQRMEDHLQESQAKIVKEYSDYFRARIDRLRYAWSGGTAETFSDPKRGVPVKDVVAVGGRLVIKYSWQDGVAQLEPIFMGGSYPIATFQGFWRQKNGMGCLNIGFPLIENGKFLTPMSHDKQKSSNDEANEWSIIASGYWTETLKPIRSLIAEDANSLSMHCKGCD
ncbi:hypothetical protein [Methylorubrum sp. SB2]|uniref:hypothetical protein n=1 Tax=Methylorubrum subtropicum TaxID=3138812 RepID=UPI00313E4927